MEIVKINRQNCVHINQANQPFEIIGKIKPTFAEGVWSYSEEIFKRSREETYPNDTWDCAAYIDDPDKAIFFAYSDAECIGQIVLKREWNRYAFIEDISVAKSARGKGVGTSLIQKAIEWAKSSDLRGLSLETQDDNLLACRFYAKCGFEIGGVDTLLYKNLGKEDSAVFWYLRFE